MQKLANLLILFSFLLTACSSIQEYNTSTPEGAYKQAEEYLKYHRYEEAIERFRSIKKKFPYSAFAKKADLKVADVNFEREAYVEAQASYQLYKDFYPKDEKIDYVTYQVGMSYFKQLPDVPGRDLDSSHDAIRAFNEVIMMFPGSEYAKKAREHKKNALKLLAQKELYIADFYYKQKEYVSALGRYEDLLNKYSNLGFNKRALYGAATSAHRAKIPAKAKKYASQLTNLFADSKEAKRAEKEIK